MSTSQASDWAIALGVTGFFAVMAIGGPAMFKPHKTNGAPPLPPEGRAAQAADLAAKERAQVSAPARPGTRPRLMPAGDPIELVTGRRYLAKIHLTGLQAMFGSKGAVDSKFRELGFGKVVIFDRDPPSYFPDRAPESSGATYWGEGSWTKADEKRKRPESITSVWMLV